MVKMDPGILWSLLLNEVKLLDTVEIRRRYCVFGSQHSKLSRKNWILWLDEFLLTKILKNMTQVIVIEDFPKKDYSCPLLSHHSESYQKAY